MKYALLDDVEGFLSFFEFGQEALPVTQNQASRIYRLQKIARLRQETPDPLFSRPYCPGR